jgi:hypothetical protein
VVEHLPSKHEILDSTFYCTRETKGERQRETQDIRLDQVFLSRNSLLTEREEPRGESQTTAQIP